VLDIAKVEAGQMRVELGPVSALRVITAAVTLVAPAGGSRGVDVDATRVRDALGEVTGDERRVRQILLNLLANAVKFTRPGGRITVRCERSRGHAPFTPRRSARGSASVSPTPGSASIRSTSRRSSSRSCSSTPATPRRAAARASAWPSAGDSRDSWAATSP
jgi:signal transduction histidine kinase